VLAIASTLLYNKYTSKEETMLIQEIKLNNGEKLEIYHDEGCFDPRKEFDNVTEMIFFHNRMNVGDEHDIDPDNYSSFAGMMNENVKDGDLAMPVFCYSKRCFELSLTPFSCPWDSGTLGFIVIRKEIIDIEFNGDRVKALRSLKAELEIYNDYLNGRTYGGILYDAEGHEIDACWGFYGDDFETNGIYDNFGIQRQDIVDIVEVA
jgi:hypothetical protein